MTLSPSISLAQLGRERVVQVDAIGEARHAAFGRNVDRAKHTGAIELVVVAMVEMPG